MLCIILYVQACMHACINTAHMHTSVYMQMHANIRPCVHECLHVHACFIYRLLLFSHLVACAFAMLELQFLKRVNEDEEDTQVVVA